MARRRKVCSTCGRDRDGQHFHKNWSTKDGLHNVCKECRQRPSRVDLRKDILSTIQYLENVSYNGIDDSEKVDVGEDLDDRTWDLIQIYLDKRWEGIEDCYNEEREEWTYKRL